MYKREAPGEGVITVEQGLMSGLGLGKMSASSKSSSEVKLVIVAVQHPASLMPSTYLSRTRTHLMQLLYRSTARGLEAL